MARYVTHRRPAHAPVAASPGTVPARHRRRIAKLEAAIATHATEAAALQRSKEAAEAANEAKTRYLVGVSHEIRSPLNAIYGYAQLLERDSSLSCEEAGAVIRRSAEHLTNLVEGLLEISRIESGVLKLRSDVVAVRAMLEQVIDMFRVQAAAKGLGLELILRDPIPDHVRTDGKRLRQILINLVSNAVKYTDKGGVTVTVGYRSHVADVEVSDTGFGIPADELERVFEPFERGGAPEALAQPGIGLGLAITRLLARIMGGDIGVTSTPGVGSRFRLRLMLPPFASPVEEAGQGKGITGYRNPRRTVLVIDDDPAQHAVLQTFLRPLGFHVHSAASGVEGLAFADRSAPDIVLLDIQMPGMSGWEVAARLRAQAGRAPKIVIVSANVHEFRAGGDGQSNHDAFVTKPIDLDDLLVVIGHQLGLHWQKAETAPIASIAQTPTPLPAAALPFLRRIRLSAEMGHVRGIDDGISEFEAALPAAAPIISTLRRQLDTLDLSSLLATLDDAGRA